MNKAELQEAKNLLQRLKNEVFVAEHSHEEQRDAIEKLLEALPDEENHLQRVIELAEATDALLSQMEKHAKAIDAKSLSYEEALSLARAKNDIQEQFYDVAEEIHKAIEAAEKNH